MRTTVSRLLLMALFGLAGRIHAQEGQLGSDFRREGQALQKSCTFDFKALGSCAYTLFTDHPMHIAAGSIAPQNGFGLGPAFVTHWTPNNSWRLSWNVDAVGSTNLSWRAGAYMTAVWDRHRRIVASPGAGGGSQEVQVREYPVFHVLAQSISLNKVNFFGIGPDTSDTARSFFGMRETITGINGTWPLWSKVNLSVYGEANGRFVAIRPGSDAGSPSIQQAFTPATAPGLASQPSFAQFAQGVRMNPAFAGGYVRLNYALTYRQFVAGDSTFSFQRFTADLNHQFPIYRRTRTSTANNFNGPDDCSSSPSAHDCPQVTRNREGSIAIRFLLNESFTAAGHFVPFYFQPTLGGSDIDGNPALGSYQDYRFRAPNDILVRATFEHSIWGPFGFTAMIDEGKVALDGSDLDFTHLRHSYGVGLTLRAGGFPMVFLTYFWGGHEGTHTTGAMNTSLLGASARPTLY